MASDSVSTPRRDENHRDTGSQAVTLCRTEPLDSSDQCTPHAGSCLQNRDSESESERSAENDLKSFSRLPPAIIERILYLTDPNGFASLALLNRKWRGIASSPKLYHLHLADCRPIPSSTGASTAAVAEDISDLRRSLNREARRNLFDVFIRPRQTLVKLISSSTSASSSFPQGEAFRFRFSAHGRTLLSLSSSRIFVIGLAVDPISVRYELKTVRRPVAATISDDGTLLAVASSEHQLNVYRLAAEQAQLTQTIALHGAPRVLEFSPEETVLSVAYDGGIEVYALGESALSTDRRAVRCSGVDDLVFSRDGLVLLGSSCGPCHSDVVTISPPLYTDVVSGLTVSELRSRMWTTQILFPEVRHRFSHVTPVRSVEDDDDVTWVVGYDLDTKAFRIAQVDDPKKGDTYFVGPGADFERDEPGPTMIPAASEDGDLLALGFQDSETRLYGLSNTPNQLQQTNLDERQARGRGSCQKHLKSRVISSNSGRLRKMVDGPKYLIRGYPLTTMKGTTAMKWVKGMNFPNHRSSHRLVAVAPGGVNSVPCDLGGEDIPIDGGRIMVFDFECSTNDGKQQEVTLEVGEVEPTPLPEHGSTLDAEVEIERRRTKINRRGGLGAANAHSVPSRFAGRPPPAFDSRPGSYPQPNSPADYEIANALLYLDNPYINTSPRSQDTLHRAATAAASNSSRSRHLNARPAQSQRVRRQVPHESDADNWVPPPPPYTDDAPAPLPDHLRITLQPSISESVSSADSLRRSHSTHSNSTTQSSLRRSLTNVERTMVSPRRQHFSDGGSSRPQFNSDGVTRRAYVDRHSDIPTLLRPGIRSTQNAETSQVSLPRNALDELNAVPETPLATDPRPVSATFYEPVSVIGRNGPTPQLRPPGSPVAAPSSTAAPAPDLSKQLPPVPPQPTSPSLSSTPVDRGPTAQQTPSGSPTQVPHRHSHVPDLRSSGSACGHAIIPRKPVHRTTNNHLDIQVRPGLPTLPNDKGVDRSRSRSHDLPRRRPLVFSGLFDHRTGLRVLTSQSDTGVQAGRSRVGAVTEDWERVDPWEAAAVSGGGSGRRRKRDHAKCIVM